jgi:magnesium-dependent phosphatase 1
LLGVLGVDKLFDYMEIFPSQKYAHFKKYKKHSLSHLCFSHVIPSSSIKKSSGIDYSDMLFFDDEYRNIRDISKLGKSMGGWLLDAYMK